MMSCNLMQLRYEGISVLSDIVVWNKDSVVLISMYGSENQLRGISSALHLWETVKVYSDNREIGRFIKNYNASMRYRSFRFGYGKYHAVMFDENMIKDCILIFPWEDEITAWKRFLRHKRIPMLDEWMLRFIEISKQVGEISELQGTIKGYYWQMTDNEACDLIVSNIYPDREAKVKEEEHGECTVAAEIHGG